jgi:hypothetical protein
LTAVEGYAQQSPNYIINGGFDIWQRGTSVALTTNAYSADRWIGNISGFTTVTQQTTGVPTGARYVARIAPTSTAQISNFYQIIETNNVAQLWGKTVTFSGKIRRNSSLTQNMAAVISKSSTVDANIASTWTSIGTFDLINSTVPTGTSSSSWLNFSVTATIPNDGTANTIYVGISSGTVPSGGYYEVAQLQLEAGSIATPFRRNAPSIQAELAACQRYYYRLISDSVYQPFGSGTWEGGSTSFLMFVTHPVQMRIVPTPGGSTLSVYNGSSLIAVNSITQGVFGGRNRSRVYLGLASNATGAQYWEVLGNNSTAAYLDFNAEL